MTNKERQKLCEWLRGASRGWSGSSAIEPKMTQAADEIERLAAENDQLTQALIDKLAEPKQSDAEPKPDDWLYSASECAREVLNYLGEGSAASMEPGMDRRRDNIAKIINRYLDKSPVPPRPDASAGLIEALQQIIDNCDDNSAPQCRHDLALKFVREVALKAIRARAADRSEKMTDEERQKLCDNLRHLPAYLSEDGMRAADEIERLAALVQSDAEPADYIPIGGAGNGA